tara:strand:+ start:164 stop:286 length:123 start_codon:yes stop_codon:yes gene_type:complete
MPVYLRNFYMQQLLKAKKTEKEQQEKSVKKSNSSKSKFPR